MLARNIALAALAFFASFVLATPQFGFDFDDAFKNAGDKAHVGHADYKALLPVLTPSPTHQIVQSAHESHSDSRDPRNNWDRTTVFDNQKPEIKKDEPKKDFWDNMPAFPNVNLRRRQVDDSEFADFDVFQDGGAEVTSSIDGEDSDFDDLGDLDSEDLTEGLILRRRGLSTNFDFIAATDLNYKLTDWDLSELREHSASLSQDDDRDFDIFRFRRLKKDDDW
uniref:Uncharacterized protein n=1 Tax=Leucosporidium scottii TaxID=5278 RepID=A0A0H5G9R4_9BASI|nr:hypothetical protein [Leucosporidium scottii]